MKRIKWIVLAISFSLGLRSEVFSQIISPPNDFQVLATWQTGDSINVFGDTLFFPINKYTATAVINVSDTTHISKINFSLGSANGNWNLLSKTFTFDNVGTLPDGTSYYRNKFNVYLGLGQYTGQDSIYSQVTLQDTAGNFTAPVFFSQAISNNSSPSAVVDTTSINIH
jgi:hypothetical protein